MKMRHVPCAYLLLAIGLLAPQTVHLRAAEPLVFISSFAGGEKGAINAFQLDEKAGALKPQKVNGGIENPFFIALSSDGKYLYANTAKSFGGKEPEQVAAFEIVGRTGELKRLNEQTSRGTATCYVDVDATGKALLVANYSSGNVASLPIKADGSLGEPESFFQHAGASVDPKRQKEPHAHCIVVSPNNRFAYAADLGVDQVLCYRLDAAAAKLMPNDPSFAKTPPGAGPRHLTFHPNGKLVYVINEISNSITAFEWNSETGGLSEKQTISTLPPDFEGRTHCADLKITPDGKFLYGTNRGHDSIAAYRIADDGKLTLIGFEPSLGKGPQNLAISASGSLLLCANMPGNNVVLFRIDPMSGRLKAVGEPIAVTSPSCIKLLP